MTKNMKIFLTVIGIYELLSLLFLIDNSVHGLFFSNGLCWMTFGYEFCDRSARFIIFMLVPLVICGFCYMWKDSLKSLFAKNIPINKSEKRIEPEHSIRTIQRDELRIVQEYERGVWKIKEAFYETDDGNKKYVKETEVYKYNKFPYGFLIIGTLVSMSFLWVILNAHFTMQYVIATEDYGLKGFSYNSDFIGALLLGLVIIFIIQYFPMKIATDRNTIHKNAISIFSMLSAFCLPLIGWVITLIWAFRDEPLFPIVKTNENKTITDDD